MPSSLECLCRSLFSVLLLGGVASTPAAAQDSPRFDAHGMRFAAGMNQLSDGMVTWRPQVGRAGSFAGTLLVDYADQTLVQVTELEGVVTEEPLMQTMVGGTALFRVALHERIGVAVEAPVQITSTQAGESQPVSLRDIRLSAPIELLDGDAIVVGVIPFADLPTGSGERLLSSGFGGGVRGAMSAEVGRLSLVGNLGVAVHPGRRLFNLSGGPRLLGGIGAAVRATDTLAMQLELDGSLGGQTDGPSGLDAPAEVVASGRWVPPVGPAFLVGAATNVTNGAGTARVRVFLGVTLGLDQGRDYDADGIVDKEDACIAQPERFNGHADDDGCPDTLSTLAIEVRDPDGTPLEGVEVRDGETVLGVTDASGALRIEDAMPGTEMSLTAAVPDGQRFREAGPLPITLEEGEATAELAFDWKPGTFRVVVLDEAGNPVNAEVTFRGAEAFEAVFVGADGEEVLELPPGTWSLVIESSEHGLASQEIVFTGRDDEPFQEVTFRLKAREVETTSEEVVVLDAVRFEKDSDVLEAASIQLLDEVAANLLKFEQVAKVEVQGHTSSEGAPEYNVDLSQRRMDNVVRYLVERGVAEDRLVAVGYGEACPLESNDTAEGRASNRRVQFIVLDPPPESGVPCHDGNPARRAEPTRLPSLE
jgi:outer membrane protein OmpA-like peptidoglycan-associated protein